MCVRVFPAMFGAVSMGKVRWFIKLLNVYVFTSDTTIMEYTNRSAKKLKVRGYMFRPSCSHLQVNLHRSSTFNVHTIWDPMLCTIMLCV